MKTNSRLCRGNLISLLSADNDYDYFDPIVSTKQKLKGNRYEKSNTKELPNTK